MACQSLNVRPEGQEPCLEIMLGRMGVEVEILLHPSGHLYFGIRRIDEISRSRVDISQSNNRAIGVSAYQEILNNPLELRFLGDSAIVYYGFELRHPLLQPRSEERAENRHNCLLRIPLDKDCDPHDRP